jgi:hypothetical protein
VVEPVATLELLGVSPEGGRFPVRVAVGLPFLKEEPSAYACEVSISPLLSRTHRIFGEGPLQALCLASQHALQILATFIEQGGVLTHNDGSEFEPQSYGFRLLGE